MSEFERNSTGFTADVEQYDDDTLIKLYRDYVPQTDIDREILCTKCVQGRGLPVPEYRGYLEKDGKRAILLEYIRGESMMKALFAEGADIEAMAEDFAAVHFRMHGCKAEGLESSKARLERLLRLSEPNLGTDLMSRCLKLMEKQPDGDRLSHNDFHPGNIIYSPKGMIAIDWSDATSGDPFADVARTVQMFDYGPTACSGNPVIPTDKITPEAVESFGRRKETIQRFTRRYEQKYVALCGLTMEEYNELVMPWKVIVPASRFYTEWDCNKPQILKMMYKYFMAHPVE